MTTDVIYLDYNASTPCDPRVVEAMQPFFGSIFANPSSRNHRPGRDAFSALEEARTAVAGFLGARSATEIIFTSGATEANNLALIGAAKTRADRGQHLVTQTTEHPSVLEVLRALRGDGWTLTEVGVDREGRIRLDELEAALEPCNRFAKPLSWPTRVALSSTATPPRASPKSTSTWLS